MPAFELLAADRYPRFTIQTQRGCPLACEFCAASMRLAPGYRVKPVERVIAEVRRVKELFPRPFIEFADDNTFCDRAHSRKLMQALEKERVHWFTESDVSVAEDEELLKMIRDAGCRQILIGLENPAAAALNGIEQSSNWKARRADRYLRAIEAIQSQGISVNGCFVLGLDGTGPDSFSELRRFVEKSGLYDVQITYMTPFPGTPLWTRLSEQGRILAEEASETCTLFDINFQPDQMSLAELESGFERLAAAIYAPRAVARRANKFRAQLRERRRR